MLALAKVGLLLGLLALGAFLALDRYLEAQLPDVLSLDGYRQTIAKTSRLYAADGSELRAYRTERRTLVPLAALPPYLPAALIASEDRTFYSHAGLDYLGMVRAMARNVREGAMREGASTLTQQLARAFYLTADKTLERKLLEVFLARKLDRHLTKEEILELYLNQVYFGDGRWGVEEAARDYFGHGAAALSLGEATALVALLPSPERLSPRADLAACRARRERVLTLMVDAGVLSAKEARATAAEPLAVAPPPVEPDLAPWFTDAVRRRLDAVLLPGQLEHDGLAVHTTLAPRAQAALDAAVAAAAPGLPDAEVAAVVLAPRSRHVLALVGGKDHGRSVYNRAVQARRQAGSTFKPFVYAAALEAGLISPDSVVSNAPLSMAGAHGRWRPHNAHRGGPDEVTVEDALIDSLNLPAIRTLQTTGLGRVTDLARRVGLRSAVPADLTAALGSGSVSVLELANAYATFAAGGLHADPVFVTRVEDIDGRLVFHDPSEVTRAVSPALAAQVTSLLEEVVAAGTAKRAGVRGEVIAGKTGTTNDARDCWFVGYTADLVVAVWVGRDDGGPQPGRTGGKVAAPIFADFLARYRDASAAQAADAR